MSGLKTQRHASLKLCAEAEDAAVA
jgi:hypothetical protein